MKLSEIQKIVDEVVAEEGVGYVYAKDRAKDPKHIPGEHWRIKFQSAKDIKKHGNTEKSKISKNEIKNVVRELIDEMWVGWEQEEAKEPEGPEANSLRAWANLKGR